MTPTALSDFDLSYAARPGSFNTFTWTFAYNYFDIYYRDENGNRKKMNLDANDGMVLDPGPMDMTKEGMLTRANNSKMFDGLNTGRSMLK